MAEGKEDVKTVGKRRSSQGTPEAVRVVRRKDEERRKRRAERPHGVAKMERKDGDVYHYLRMVVRKMFSLVGRN